MEGKEESHVDDRAKNFSFREPKLTEVMPFSAKITSPSNKKLLPSENAGTAKHITLLSRTEMRFGKLPIFTRTVFRLHFLQASLKNWEPPISNTSIVKEFRHRGTSHQRNDDESIHVNGAE